MDQFKNLVNLETQSQTGSNGSNQLPSSYHSTTTSFYHESANDLFHENEENSNKKILRNETEETILDGSCDNLGKLSANRNSKLVVKSTVYEFKYHLLEY